MCLVVLGVVVPVFMAGAGMRHYERLKPFLAYFGQHRGGGHVGVPLGSTFVGCFRTGLRGGIWSSDSGESL